MRPTIRSCFPRIAVAALSFVALFAVTTLRGQVDTGSISGTVSDSSGAVVSGAEVTLISEGTGVSLTTRTGADGIYRFSPVRIGSYQLKAIAKGFETETQAGVKVDIQSHILLNFTLRPGMELDRQRADVRQFVISEKGNTSSSHSGSIQP
jgi:Carboxypeptidase regulatory-like domain